MSAAGTPDASAPWCHDHRRSLFIRYDWGNWTKVCNFVRRAILVPIAALAAWHVWWRMSWNIVIIDRFVVLFEMPSANSLHVTCETHGYNMRNAHIFCFAANRIIQMLTLSQWGRNISPRRFNAKPNFNFPLLILARHYFTVVRVSICLLSFHHLRISMEFHMIRCGEQREVRILFACAAANRTQKQWNTITLVCASAYLQTHIENVLAHVLAVAS